MRDGAEEGKRVPPRGRTPGKYLVIGGLALGAVFLAGMILLAMKLDPAADRFHNPPSSTPKKN